MNPPMNPPNPQGEPSRLPPLELVIPSLWGGSKDPFKFVDREGLRVLEGVPPSLRRLQVLHLRILEEMSKVNRHAVPDQYYGTALLARTLFVMKDIENPRVPLLRGCIRLVKVLREDMPEVVSFFRHVSWLLYGHERKLVEFLSHFASMCFFGTAPTEVDERMKYVLRIAQEYVLKPDELSLLLYNAFPPPRSGESEEGSEEQGDQGGDDQDGEEFPLGGLRFLEPEVRVLVMDTDQPLTKRRAFVADDYGCVLWNRMFHRLTLDQKVFKRRVKRPSRIGVLLDVSGSMNYSEEDIERLLTNLPPGSVAAFYGAGLVDHSGFFAFIDVIADGTRRASKYNSSLYGWENLCDLPALKWLLAQDVDERFWVSDGLATMIGEDDDPFYDGGISQLFAIENGIRRLDTIEEVWSYLGLRPLPQFHKEDEGV